MEIDTVKLAYFSPTGTTRKVLQGIAEGIGAETVEDIDMTLPDAPVQQLNNVQDELFILGVPVYEGRVATVAIPRLEQLKTENTLAVIVVLYGNRDYEDALLELNDISRDLGFLPIAGGAFVGEHSFANTERPLGNGRPDADDLSAAKEFGVKIRKKLDALDAIEETSLVTPPGNNPYISRDRSALEDRSATTLNDICTLCGDCASFCPVGAIKITESVETDNMACILCNACVKNCETGARTVDDPMINKIANWVSRNFQARREPETFI